MTYEVQIFEINDKNEGKALTDLKEHHFELHCSDDSSAMCNSFYLSHNLELHASRYLIQFQLVFTETSDYNEYISGINYQVHIQNANYTFISLAMDYILIAVSLIALGYYQKALKPFL